MRIRFGEDDRRFRRSIARDLRAACYAVDEAGRLN
jgi:hypothetical protein